ncbi:MAG: hypothetical protein AAFU85_11190 [Planctomycetota bacterium]
MFQFTIRGLLAGVAVAAVVLACWWPSSVLRIRGQIRRDLPDVVGRTFEVIEVSKVPVWEDTSKRAIVVAHNQMVQHEEYRLIAAYKIDGSGQWVFGLPPGEGTPRAERCLAHYPSSVDLVEFKKLLAFLEETLPNY